MNPKTATFEQDCHKVMTQLRSAFVELYADVSADPASPQAVSRRFKLNKTLTWNVSRLLRATDGITALPHVPGRTAIEKMLKATGREGASRLSIDRVRSAADQFDKLVEIHLGDRATLDLVVDAFPQSSSDGLELSRKLAFRGNSGICGIQARTRSTTWFLAPNIDDPSRLDLALLSGHVGLRRLRRSVQWPIFKVRQWSDTNEPISSGDWQPIEESDGTGGDSGIAIIRSHTKGPVPEIKVEQTDEGTDYILMPGPIGNRGACDCFRGETMRSAANRYRKEGDEIGELGFNITSPASDLLFDAIIHRDLDFTNKLEVLFFGRIHKDGERAGSDDDPSLLPIRPPLIHLAGSPPAIATPLIPGYADLVSQVYAKMDWKPEEFIGIRVLLKYPPLNSSGIMRLVLPEAP